MPELPFLERLKNTILVCDGAMGTMLYSRGIFINRSFEELNLTNPELVLQIHQEYNAARADILESNTFGANRFKLRNYGLDDKVTAINQRGAELAREAGGAQTFVAGSIGPLGVALEPLGILKEKDAFDAFAEQAEALLRGGVDLYILETFHDVHEISVAISALQSIGKIPIIAQMTFDEQAQTKYGAYPEVVVEALLQAGADVIGANCSVGPQPMLDVIERMAKAGAKWLSAQPNAGNPRIHEGRYLYMSTPEYHAEFSRRLIAAGANVIGGCCGTTPSHIRAIVNAVRAIQPHRPAVTISTQPKKEAHVQEIPREEKSALAARLGKKFVVSVEVLSPRGIDPAAVIAGVKKLVGFGIDAINIPDGPRASARMSPLALAQLIERSLPVETILHYCCRDRNLLGMQSDLLGAYALGLRNILVITGDPPKMGDYPDATAVFDVDSIGLTRVLYGLNHGFDISASPIGMPTGWHIGVGANPTALDLDLEIDRLRQKAQAGAEYILTQPVFDLKQLETFLWRINDIDIPILAGIMPLISYRTVEFLNNEVPGVSVPDDIAKRLASKSSADEAKSEGIKIAQDTIQKIRHYDKIKGLYLMPPFSKDKYGLAIEVLQVIR